MYNMTISNRNHRNAVAMVTRTIVAIILLSQVMALALSSSSSFPPNTNLNINNRQERGRQSEIEFLLQRKNFKHAFQAAEALDEYQRIAQAIFNDPNKRVKKRNESYRRNGHGGCIIQSDDISVGLAALNRLYDQNMAHPRLVTSALHVLCKYQAAGVTDMNSREYLPTHEVAFRFLLRLLSGRGINEKKRRSVESPVQVSHREFHAVLNSCVSAGRMDLANKVFAAQKRVNPSSLSAVTYSILIKGHGRVKDLKMVSKMMRSARTNFIKPDRIMLNSAIDAYVRCDDLDRARAILNSMHSQKDEELMPNARSYNTVLKGYARRGLVHDAVQLSDQMSKMGINDGVTRNTLVSAAVNAEEFELAEKILENDAQYITTTNSSALIEAYTSLIDGFGKRGKLDEVERVLGMMVKRGIKPNEITYTCMIGHLAANGKISEADAMMTLMRRELPRSVKSVIPFNAYLTGLLSDLEGRSSSQTSDILQRDIINVRVDQALEVLERMMNKNKVNPNLVTVALMCDALCRKAIPARTASAAALIEYLESRGSIPRRDQKLYTILITGYGREGQLDKIQSAWSKMKRRDTIAFNAYLNAIGNAIESYSNYEGQSGTPNVNIKNIMEEYVLQSNTTAELTISPDVVTFSTAITYIRSANSSRDLVKSARVLRDVQELYNFMRKRLKIDPDAGLVEAVYTAIISSSGGKSGRRNPSQLYDTEIKFLKRVLSDAKMCAVWGDDTDEEYNNRMGLLSGLNVNIDDAFLQEKGWNSMDSSFRIWGGVTDETTSSDEFLGKKGWNDVDSGFRII